jgi:hypothetical protein
MAINSTNSNATGGKSLTYSQILDILGNNNTGAALSYVKSKIQAGASINNLFSQSEYLTSVQNLGFEIEQFNNNYYAKKVFLSSSSWTIPSIFVGVPCIALVVAGGGSGGWDVPGGGGAGGLIFNENYVPQSSTPTITVGSGGAGVTGGAGNQGGNSVFDTLTAIGGGRAGGWSDQRPTIGGSGGGSEGKNANITASGAAGTVGQGYAGGNAGGNVDGYSIGGGGGGAGGEGSSGPNGAHGGIGRQIFGIYYAGGGGGASNSFTVSGSGGLGGGGLARSSNNGLCNGQVNTGGGGAGSEAVASGSGGSGIVIVRYQIT